LGKGWQLMPIEYDFPLKVLSQDEFHAIDRVVMRQSFDVQNEFGRFYNEEIYHNELAFRLKEQGLSVVSEGMRRVGYQDFMKHYYVDALVGNGALYELKAVDALTGAHEKQLLHYLFLLGLKHGKLINFLPASVEYRFEKMILLSMIL
jgi:GxxExxY protein